MHDARHAPRRREVPDVAPDQLAVVSRRDAVKLPKYCRHIIRPRFEAVAASRDGCAARRAGQRPKPIRHFNGDRPCNAASS
jgi:hypothetical protein